MKNHTVLILEKNTLHSAFAIDASDGGEAFVGRFDLRREPNAFHQTTDTLEQAQEILKSNLKISVERGWRVLYCGERNFG